MAVTKKVKKRKSKKLIRKVKRKPKNTRRSHQKGGTQFRIHGDDFGRLEHIGVGNASKNSCASCVLNSIGFPDTIVDELSDIAGRDSRGNSMADVNNKINDVTKEITDNKGKLSKIYYWGASKDFNSDGVRVIEVIDLDTWQKLPRDDSIVSLTSRDAPLSLFDDTLKQIFNILQYGTSTVLGILWAEKPGGYYEGTTGHFVEIAKSFDGTPYLIESQNIGDSLQRVYRGMRKVKSYFYNSSKDVAYFITFNNSKPTFKNGEWVLDSEEILDLKKLPKKKAKSLDKDKSRNVCSDEIPYMSRQCSLYSPEDTLGSWRANE